MISVGRVFAAQRDAGLAEGWHVHVEPCDAVIGFRIKTRVCDNVAQPWMSAPRVKQQRIKVGAVRYHAGLGAGREDQMRARTDTDAKLGSLPGRCTSSRIRRAFLLRSVV